eukprot:6397066-Alexandrium_andersonii.AAC.1
MHEGYRAAVFTRVTPTASAARTEVWRAIEALGARTAAGAMNATAMPVPGRLPERAIPGFSHANGKGLRG